MNTPIKVCLVEPDELYIEYSDGMKGSVKLDDILNHEDYKDIRDKIDASQVKIGGDGDILIGGKVKLCKNAAYGILAMKAQMKRLGLEL